MLDIANAKVRRTANGTFDQTVFGEDQTVKRLADELSEDELSVLEVKINHSYGAYSCCRCIFVG